MCGFAGLISLENKQIDNAHAQIERMSRALLHRGPDDCGTWVDPKELVALGHRRLAIVDLSATGHQPMSSDCGRFVLVFNGEIYNHQELRQALGASNSFPFWRGTSDTEILLACIAFFGLKRSLQISVGMFAIAVWGSTRADALPCTRSAR